MEERRWSVTDHDDSTLNARAPEFNGCCRMRDFPFLGQPAGSILMQRQFGLEGLPVRAEDSGSRHLGIAEYGRPLPKCCKRGFGGARCVDEIIDEVRHTAGVDHTGRNGL